MLSYIIVTIIVSVTLLSQCQTRRITQWRRQSNGRTFRKDYTYREAGKSFYKYHTITKNWTDAKKVCLGEKAELFYAMNKKEADDVIKFWKSKGSDSWRMYVGISDIVTEGKFVTIHGRPISEVYYLWEKGQPDNWNGDEDCVVINKRGEMNDVQCSLSLNFMCKRTLESLPKTTTKKPTTTTKKATTTTKKATTTTKKATTTTKKATTTTKKATTTTKKATTTTKKATTTTTKPTTTTKKATTTTKKATTTTTKPTTTTKKATTTTTKPTTTTTKPTTTTTKATTTTKRATTTIKSTSSCKMQSNNTGITLKTFVFWPNATVPFYINPDHFGEDQIRVILESLAMFEFETCIKFLPLMVAPVEGQHVMTFINPKGVRRCTIETNGHSNYSPHLIQLGYNCMATRELNTIIMRALGLPFEHNRACRDLYIDVWIENIEPSYIQLFTKDCNLPIELRNIPYDLFSIMHFGERDYSKNGHRTIRIKNEIVVQARNGISATDIKKIGLTASDIKKLAVIYGPECRTRDRAEQIAKCLTYPGVTRRKRENRQWATKPMGASRPGMQKTMTTRRTYNLRGTEASLKF